MQAQTGWEYAPLRGSEIRLVRFEQTGASSENIKLTIQHFDVHDAPPYIALSYVWGAPGDVQQVSLNHLPFPVGENLYEALSQIRKTAPYLEEGIQKTLNCSRTGLFLWIDAICINQASNAEKSKQVPRMSTIYSTAFTVLIWFGTLEKLGAGTIGFHTLMCFSRAIYPEFAFWPPEAATGDAVQAENERSPMTRMVEAYIGFLENDWFYRTWVIQEYSLSRRDACSLAGPYLFPLRSLHATGKALQKMAVHPDLSSGFIEGPYIQAMSGFIVAAFGPILTADYIASEEYSSMHPARQLLQIKMNLANKESTLPHDQIYGVLGIINVTRLPEELMPNYDLPYGLVCKDYTRFIIEHTCDLRILMFSPGIRLEGQPTWVVDFSHVTACRIVPDTQHTGHFSDGDSLVVEGCKLGKILSYFSGDNDPTRERMTLFYDTLLTAAAGIQERALAEVWKEWLSDFLTHCRHDAALVSEFPTFSDFVHRVTPEGDNTDTIHGELILRLFGASTFALLNDGAVLWCARHQLENIEAHEVWAFRGSVQRSIVERQDDTTYKYVGWLEDSEARFDIGSYLSDNVERITLV